ncbi:MAG TPA: permease-like cell division protein FtsX [Candidatus Paceibacterota bacterium]
MSYNKITFQRILKSGITKFFRGGLISVATVLVMSLSMLVFGGVLVGGIFVNGIISGVEDKVDISVYFKLDSPEEKILSFKEDLESNINVKSVSYVSKEKALESFLGRHKGDTLILRSIETVENNPFSANLDINAKSTDKFEDITRFIEASAYSSLIDIDSMGKQKITFRQNEEAINKLSNVLSVSRKIGFSVSGILALIALMVAYNTVRVAIYNSKDEIAVMQLVGASRSFIRGPFLIEGLIHGFISAVFTLLALYGILFWTGERIASAFGGLNIYTYFVSNILQISFILLVAGALLGVLSAQFATKRYLKV